MQSVYRSVVPKNESSPKAKLVVYWSVCAPNLSYGERELWVVTERRSLWIQAAKMSFSCRDRVRSSDTREELRVESLLLLGRCSRDSASWPAKAGEDKTRNDCSKRVTRSGKCVWGSSSSRVAAWCCWRCASCLLHCQKLFFCPWVIFKTLGVPGRERAELASFGCRLRWTGVRRRGHLNGSCRPEVNLDLTER